MFLNLCINLCLGICLSFYPLAAVRSFKATAFNRVSQAEVHIRGLCVDFGGTFFTPVCCTVMIFEVVGCL
jgi:hypothetical protein